MTSPYLKTKSRSRVQAAYDVCPELKDVVSRLETAFTPDGRVYVNLLANAEWRKSALAALRKIQEIELAALSPADPHRDQWEGE